MINQVFTLNRLNSLLWILFWVFMLSKAVAADPEPLVSQENTNWEVFTNRSHITELLLSDDGKTLWVGTTGGLEQRNASTGQLVQVFTNLNGLPNNNISALESDGNGGLWIGTLDGLANHSISGEWTVYTKDNFVLPSVRDLESDGNGGLWISSADYSKYPNDIALTNRSVSGEWTVYTKDNLGLPEDNSAKDYFRPYVLESDSSGGLWIGTEEGYLVNRSLSGEWTVYNTDNSGLPFNYIGDIESDDSGGLWIVGGTAESAAGLAYRSVNGEWTVDTKDNSGLLYNYVCTLESDGNGGLWMNTAEEWWGYDQNLTHRSVNGEWTVYTKDNWGLPNDYFQTTTFLHDDKGGLWIGTERGGLVYRSVSSEWTVYDEDYSSFPDLPSNDINAIEIDSNGELWIGTYDGLANRSVSGEWTVYTKYNSELPDNSVNVLESDSNGGMWIGTYVHSIGGSDGPYTGLSYRSVSGEWVLYNTDNSGLPNNIILDLENDGSGGLWIGTTAGLANRNVNGEWTVYTADNSVLPSNRIRNLLRDDSGGLWIYSSFGYSDAGGLVYLSVSGEWTLYNDRNRIREMGIDDNGRLWVLSNGIMSQMVNDKWSTYRVLPELPNDYIYVILSDGNGGLWIGTYDGLAHLSGGKLTIYNTDNSGLPGNSSGALLRDDNGGLWIGTDGLAHLTLPPDTATDNSTIPKLCATVTEIPQAECGYLVALYNSTDGPNWEKPLILVTDSIWFSWNVTNTPCSWYGISCHDGHITHIDLGNNKLKGSLPDWSALTSLKSIYLAENQLSGPIPDWSTLTSLERIDLRENQLSGPIPDVSTLTNLTELVLNDNQLSGDIPLSLSNTQVIDSRLNNNSCLTASDPTLVAFLDSKAPEWATTQSCFLTTPIITNVTPLTSTINEVVIFTVIGTNLTDGMGFTVAECEPSNDELPDGTSTQRQFQCTQHGSPGSKRGLVKDAPGGQILYEFTVEASEAVSELPELGNGIIIYDDWTQLDTEAIFAGGTAVNGEPAVQHVTVDKTDTVFIQGNVIINPTHVGMEGDLISVAEYITGDVKLYFMQNQQGEFLPWEINLSTLVGRSPLRPLSDVETIDIYNNPLTGLHGTVHVFFGYRVENMIIINNIPDGIMSVHIQ